VVKKESGGIHKKSGHKNGSVAKIIKKKYKKLLKIDEIF
jgi:hypothetical protein